MKKKSWQKTLGVGINLVAQAVLVFNMTAVGVLVTPSASNAADAEISVPQKVDVLPDTAVKTVPGQPAEIGQGDPTQCEYDKEGWWSDYYNYDVSHPDMGLPAAQWPDAGHGNPMGAWDADWYDSGYHVASWINGHLNFGSDFFPLDYLGEDPAGNDGDHNYHFGAHFRARVKAPSAGNYYYSLTSDDDSWVYLDGSLVDSLPGIHAPLSTDGMIALDNEWHIVDVYYAERHIELAALSFVIEGVDVYPFPPECDYSGVNGWKWNDLNGNGEWEKGESGLADWTIQLWQGEKMIGFTETDKDGEYVFNNVLSGEYKVCEVQQKDWTQTYPEGCHTVNVNGDGDHAYNFGNHQNEEQQETVTIVAHKLVCDNESDLPNWGDGSGPDVIGSLAAQQYADAQENCELQEGWDFQWGYADAENPGDNTGESSEWNTFGPTDVDGMTYVEISEEELGDNNQLWFREVWQDDYIPFSETVLPGELDDVSAEFYCNTDVLNYDNYEWISDPELGQTYYCVAWNVMEEQEDPTYNLGGYKWVDTDGNGEWDEGEEAYPDGWSITLTSEEGKASPQTVMTNEDGRYMFSDLPAGEYTICEQDNPAWIQTYPGTPECHEASVGPFPAVSVLDQLELENKNFGNFEMGSVSGYKFHDRNEDGAKAAAGEEGLEGWEINLWTGCVDDFSAYDLIADDVINLQDFVRFTQLYTQDNLGVDYDENTLLSNLDLTCFGYLFNQVPGSQAAPNEPVLVDSTLTDADGYYEFNGLEAGTYTLTETMQDNWTQSMPGETGNFKHADLVLQSGDDFSEKDFGNFVKQDEPEPEPESVPVLSLTKVDDVDPVNAGDTFTYTMSWVLGEADANLVLTDPIPENLSLVSVGNDGVYNEESNTITWDLGNQTAGSSGTVAFSVQVDETMLDGTSVENTATIRVVEEATEGEISTAAVSEVSATASEETAVTNSPILSLTKTVDTTDFVAPGDEVNYTVTVENFGYAVAKNVTLTDALPDGSLFYQDELGSERTLVDGGNLAIGDNLTFTYPVTVSSDATSGTYLNTATLTADNHGSLTATASVRVQEESGEVLGDEALPNLTVEKSVSVPFANPGDTVQYTVSIINSGEAPAVNLTVNDVLPLGLTFSETGSTNREWNLESLEAGESVSFSYDVLIGATTAASPYRNLVTVTSDNHDPVTGAVDLEVRSGAVLGADTELADTGVSGLDYIVMSLAALLLTAGTAGYLWLNRRERKLKS
ncbi:MAG: SdrD B-like domain-containing protein [bacterium]|nr:SdrD B-like domain-containing protein [bacterium]